MEFEWDDFEWDNNKAAVTLGKHGLTFDEAREIFADFLTSTVHSQMHSEGEHRFVTFGVTSAGRYMAVCHTFRVDRIRIISARSMTPEERRNYERGEVREMEAEYSTEFMSRGVRGKFYERYREGTNVIELAPDTYATFRRSKAVNDALRELLASMPASDPRLLAASGRKKAGIRGMMFDWDEERDQPTNVVLLEEDVWRVFWDSRTVNDALRELLVLRHKTKQSA